MQTDQIKKEECHDVTLFIKGFASSKNPGVVIVFALLRGKSYKNTVEWLEKTGV